MAIKACMLLNAFTYVINVLRCYDEILNCETFTDNDEEETEDMLSGRR